MYDLSKEFEKFYNDYVVLPNKEQNDLRNKKNINIKRLKDGLKEYNQDNNTTYKIAETRVQGSMAMHTVVQNDNKDYDIDVAIIFEKDNLKDNEDYLGSRAARNIVRDALKKKCSQFNVEPETLTNCVRVTYADGYHIDFAVYRRFKEAGSTEYTYEHAGSSWTSRNPAAINEWFSQEIEQKGQELRKVIRLSKMFCKSRDSWVNMPGGLLQTVLCDEKIQTSYDRLDEIFYYTMHGIKSRLENSIEVYNPTDTSLPLLTTDKHRTKMNNWKTRLQTELDKLDVLFDEECDRKSAIDAWHSFFEHDFWTNESVISESFALRKSYLSYTDTEEFIENEVCNICEQYYVKVDCKVEAKGFPLQSLNSFFENHPIFNRFLPHGFSIDFDVISTNVPEPYSVWWKVRNVGAEAEKRNDIRGQIEKKYYKHKHETAKFYGPHYVECYIIKNGECVAIEHINVPIGHS